MVAVRYGRAIRFMRLDGEQSLGSEFQEYMKLKGITVERTPPYTQAQNGHSERAGRTLITAARAIQLYANLPINLWPEAYRTAGYLINRLPHRQLHWKSPYEAVLGRKPNLAHLYLFGCTAYSLIHNIPKLKKPLPRASVGYLVGYDSSNIYRIWNPRTGTVFRTRDVTFDESAIYQPG